MTIQANPPAGSEVERTDLITVTIDDKSLTVQLDAFNTGDELFSFTAALHTYIALADIRESAIRGFTGKWYLDKTQGGNETKDEAKKMVISDETDRVYLKAPKKVEVEDRGNDRRIEIRHGHADVVDPAEHRRRVYLQPECG